MDEYSRLLPNLSFHRARSRSASSARGESLRIEPPPRDGLNELERISMRCGLAKSNNRDRFTGRISDM